MEEYQLKTSLADLDGNPTQYELFIKGKVSAEKTLITNYGAPLHNRWRIGTSKREFDSPEVAADSIIADAKHQSDMRC